jgi:hypothetical protein
VVLSDDAPGTATATATNTVTVVEGDTLSVTATPVFAVEGTPFTGAVVATFTDTDPGTPASLHHSRIELGIEPVFWADEKKAGRKASQLFGR